MPSETIPDKIHVRSYQPGDERWLIPLLGTFYTHAATESAWRRLYFENPEGPAMISVAEDHREGVVFGHYSVIPMPLVSFGRRMLAGKGEAAIFDLARLRRMLAEGFEFPKDLPAKVVAHALSQAEAKGVACVLTNPNELALGSHRAAGFQVLPNRFETFVRVGSRRYLEHLLHKQLRNSFWAGLGARAGMGLVGRRLSWKRRIPARLKMTQERSFEPWIGPLFQRFVDGTSCITIDRTARHLAWRFPEPEYRTWRVEEGGFCIGYAVVRTFTNPNGFKEAKLVDFLFLPNVWDRFPSVLDEVLGVAADESCDLFRVDYLYDGKERFGVSSILRKFRFISRSDPRNLVLYIPSSSPAEVLKLQDLQNWMITDLYFDGY